MEQKRDVLIQIQKKYSKLSKGQKLIAQYIIENYDKAAFMTASKLGHKVGVSESTVVRFANVLGFDGYPELQKELQEVIKTKLTTVQRVEMAKEYASDEDILKNVLKSDIENVRFTLDNINYDTIHQVVDHILKAEKLYIVGLRSSTALAEYFGFYLNLILDNVKIVSYGISDIFEQMLRVSDKDLVIGIGFPRYSNRTIEALKFAKQQNTTIVAITDSLLSPLTDIADYSLTAKSNMASFVDSLVAPLSLINALIVAIGMRKKEEITEYFDKLENLWDIYNVYNGREED